MITPITSAMTIANRKLRLFRTAVNFAPNSFFSRGNVTTPTMVSVVRKATAGHLVPDPAMCPTVDFGRDRAQAFAFCALARTPWEKCIAALS